MSLSVKIVGLFVCGLVVSASGTLVWAADDTSEVVAEIGGKKITRAQFEQQKSAELLNARYKFY